MASISTDARGNVRLQYIDTEGERKTIRLGKVSKRDAATIKSRVESLLTCKFWGTQPAPDLLHWVNELAPVMREKLSHHGLVEVSNFPKKKTKLVKDYLTEYLKARKPHVKPGTFEIWETAVKSLNDYLPESIALSDLNDGIAKDWLDKLRSSKKFAPTTIYKRVSFARQFFDYAVDHKQLKENPFLSLKIVRPKKKSNVEVPRATITKLLAVCDTTWQAIIVLSRYGGLRCPSEVLTLKWSEVDFKLGKMTITAPKNEHHDGDGIRECPLFPEVRAVLEKLKRKNEYVVDKQAYRDAADSPTGWKNANLRTQFMKQLAKAKIKPWARIFHSMRASRQTEVEQEFGLPAACAWLGNTESVAKESYLMVFDDTWKRATGKGGA